jgi:hypothetical protein
MRDPRFLFLALLACGALFLAGCSDDGGDDNDTGVTDQGGDQTTDTGEDATEDTTPDATEDTTPDATEGDADDDAEGDTEGDADDDADATIEGDADATIEGDADATFGGDADATVTADADATIPDVSADIPSVDAVSGDIFGGDAFGGGDTATDGPVCEDTLFGLNRLLIDGATCEGDEILSCLFTDGSADCSGLAVGEFTGTCFTAAADFFDGATCGLPTDSPCFLDFDGIGTGDPAEQVLCAGEGAGCVFDLGAGGSRCETGLAACNFAEFTPYCDDDVMVFSCLVDQPFGQDCGTLSGTCDTAGEDIFCVIPVDGECNADLDGTGDSTSSDLRCAEGLTCDGETAGGDLGTCID